MEDKIENLLLTWEEYTKKLTSDLYLYEISGKKQSLSCVGTNHIYDPNSSKLIQIKNIFDQFSSFKKAEETIVVIEARPENILQYSVDTHTDPFEIVKDSAEAGFIAKISQDAGIEVVGLELSRKEYIMMVENIFSKNEVYYHYVSTITAQWHRFKDKPEYDEYINKYINYFSKNAGWVNYEFSLSNFKKIHSEIFRSDFDLSNRQFFSDITDPAKHGTIINDVARTISNKRDVHIAKSVIEFWNKGKSVFMLYGNSHVIRIEPVLKKFCV